MTIKRHKQPIAVSGLEASDTVMVRWYLKMEHRSQDNGNLVFLMAMVNLKCKVE